MTIQSKSLLFSLVFHTGLICLAIVLSNAIEHASKEIVLDFTDINSNTQPAPQVEAPMKKKAEIKQEKNSETQIKKVEKSVHEKPVPTASPLPVPVAGTAGTVPMLAPTNQVASVPQSQTIDNKTAAHAGDRGQVTAGEETVNSVEQMTNRYLKLNFEYIKVLIQKSIVYPAMARRMGLTGKVVVSFVITENGRAENEKIIVSSGHTVLDNNVIETIRMVEPFPKPPVRAELRIPIVYRFN